MNLEERVEELSGQLTEMVTFCSSLVKVVKESQENNLRLMKDLEVMIVFFSEKLAACSNEDPAAVLQELNERIRLADPGSK